MMMELSIDMSPNLVTSFALRETMTRNMSMKLKVCQSFQLICVLLLLLVFVASISGSYISKITKYLLLSTCSS